MEISKQQIINGIIKYATNDVVGQIPDKNFKIIAMTAVGMAQAKPEILNGIFDNPTIKAMEGTNGYDLDAVASVLKQNIDSAGGFTVTVPPTKFLMPEEKQLTFKGTDIDRMLQYIKGDI